MDQSAPGAPLRTDADGDVAHEFWEEDEAGNLIIKFPGEEEEEKEEEEGEEEEEEV